MQKGLRIQWFQMGNVRVGSFCLNLGDHHKKKKKIIFKKKKNTTEQKEEKTSKL